MSQRVRGDLKFASVEDAIDDVQRLRRGGYDQHGNWSLPQVCWHVSGVLEPHMRPASDTTATPEQTARWQGFLSTIRKPGGASTFPAPPHLTPADDVGDDVVDRLVALLGQLRAFPHSHVDLGKLGPQPIGEFTEAHLLHAAHHLGFLQPRVSKRVGLHFDTIPAIMAEVQRLRAAGCTQTGNWSLEQMCFHLGRSIPLPLKAVAADLPPTPDPQLVHRFQHYADHDAPMAGISAPPGSEPPATLDAGIVDDYINRLRTANAFNDAFVDLGPRGPVPLQLYKGFLRGHAAHHLSFLVPTAQ